MRKLLVALIVLTLTAAVAPAYGDDGGRPLSATLTGAAEVPGPGDPDASGSAAVRLNPGQGEVCFDVSWADIDGEVFASHIHVGTADVAGPVVITLFTGSFAGTGQQSACVQGVDRDLIVAIIQNPEGYYVNIHSTVFPAGAIRGQLTK